MKAIYFVKSLKDNEEDIEKIWVEFPYTVEIYKGKINIEAKNTSIKPYYILHNFKSQGKMALKDKCIIDFNNKEIIY